MQPTPTRRALVVRGGWEGHEPVEATKRFIPFLEENGFEVEVSESLDVYLDPDRMAGVDLVLQLWTMGTTTDAHVEGLATAVRNGTGLAGWHGGIVDSFRNHPDYLHLTGGQFATHPGDFRQHSVHVVPEKADHPIVAGISPSWDLYTEQYWILTDAYNEVLATTTYRPRRARRGTRTSSSRPSGPGCTARGGCSSPRSGTSSTTSTTRPCGR